MKLSKCVAMVLLGAFVLVAFSQVGWAEEHKGEKKSEHKGRMGGWTPEMMLKRLDLTEEQKEQVKAILKQRQEDIQGVRKDSELSKEDKMAKAKEIVQSSQQKIEEILTAEQKEKYAAMKEKMLAHKKKGQPRKRWHKKGEKGESEECGTTCPISSASSEEICDPKSKKSAKDSKGRCEKK